MILRILRSRAWMVLLVVAAVTSGVTGAVHPQDGPHADIRASIDEKGVEFGLMINLAFIDEILDLPRESRDAVDPVEEPMLQAGVESFFREQFVVEVDGVRVEPLVSGFEVIRAGVENLPLFPRAGMRGLINVKLRLEYPAKSIPRNVRFVWPVYPPDVLAEPDESGRLPPMTMQAQLSAEGRVSILRFTADEPEQTWHGSGKTREELFEAVPSVVAEPAVRLPVLAVGIAVAGLMLLARGATKKARAGGRFGWIVAGVALLAVAPAFRGVGAVALSGDRGGLPTEAEAEAIFGPLHANVYRAFDYDRPGAIYDALERSVSGDLLETLYDQIYRSLIMAEEGDAMSRVAAVRLDAVEVLSIGFVSEGVPGFTVRAQWQVDGVVYHANHSHERTNEYVAEYSVAQLPVGWRITGNRVLSQQRLDPETGKPPVADYPDGEI